MKTRSVALLGAFTALALACSRGEGEKAAAPPTPETPRAAAMPPGERPVRQPTEKGIARRKAAMENAKITQGDLPEGFPSDIPVFPDSRPKTSMLVGQNGLVVLSSSAPVADVLAHYREQLPPQGWTVDSVKEDKTGQAFLKAHKGTRNTSISINPAKTGGGTEIGVAISGS